MGKRNVAETLEQSAAYPATPQNKRQRLQDTVDIKPGVTETPPQTYTLTKELVEDTILLDLNLQKWRVGQPVGTYIAQCGAFYGARCFTPTDCLSVCRQLPFLLCYTYTYRIGLPRPLHTPRRRGTIDGGLVFAFLALALSAEFESLSLVLQCVR